LLVTLSSSRLVAVVVEPRKRTADGALPVATPAGKPHNNEVVRCRLRALRRPRIAAVHGLGRRAVDV